MPNITINRREFLKFLGIGTTSLGATFSVSNIIGNTKDGILVKSENEYGGFVVEKFTKNKYPYEYKPNILKRMSEKMTIFSRNWWDPIRQRRPELNENIPYEHLVKGNGKVPNQTRLDFAFMAASWHSARSALSDKAASYQWHTHPGMVKELELDSMEPWNPENINMSWEEASLALKHAALFYGASQAGIAVLNPLWLYCDNFAPTENQSDRAIPVLSEGERFEQTDDAWYIPKSMDRVIAIIFEEDYRAIANSPGRLASAACGNGYSRMAVTSATLAEFIRGLGYRALPAGNGVGLSIPMAIDAGLGQLGRLGQLITPKYGPRVRIAKVITDMPLIPDPAISFGVTEFCDMCKLCADYCPSRSISNGQRTWEGNSPSNNHGAYKWYIEGEKCYDYNGFSCSNCKRVCPFNKPTNSWLHRMTRQFVKGRLHSLDKIMVTFDQTSGYGKQLQANTFWKMDGQKTITARESM